jgi:hypothetical protein
MVASKDTHTHTPVKETEKRWMGGGKDQKKGSKIINLNV